MRLNKAVDKFLAYRQLERDATPSSLASYYRILAKLAERYPEERLSDFEGRQGTEKLRDFLGQWARRSSSTRANVISVLHSFFAWAESEDLIEADPSRKIRRPPKRKPDVYRPSEVDLLLGRRATRLEERPAWLLMEGLGLRASTVTKVRWSDLDLTRGQIRVLVKGGHRLSLPIDPDILKELQDCYRVLEPDPSDHVFVAEVLHFQGVSRKQVRTHKDPSVPASTAALWRMTRRVCKRAGVKEFGPHALRHGFATRFLRESQHDVTVLRDLMGHRHLSTTEQYVEDLRIEELRETLELVAKRRNDPDAQALPIEETLSEKLGIAVTRPVGIEPTSAIPGEESTGGSEDEPPLEPEKGGTK